MRFSCRLPVAILVLLVLPIPAAGQQPDPNDKTPVHELTLEKHPEFANGRIAMVEGEAGAEGVRLVISKLSILQPVGVALVALDPNDDLQLSLWKYAEDEVQRQGSTRGDGYVSFQFRTEDDLQIKIVSPDGPKRYRLAVWAGDEVEVPVPSPFVAQAGFTGTGTSPLMYVIAMAVVAIAVFMGVIAMRRRKA
ncbi:MAG: hypothetical protein M3Q55_12345 [Acidobacteriota bacterium]|nr:hypothetical protein [Acidobacteriota bacterium]